MSDRINTSLLTDLENVNETNYEYQTNFNDTHTTSNEWTVMKSMTFKQDYASSIATGAREIKAPGRYPMGIEATWTSGADGLNEAVVTIQETGRIIPEGKARATLDDLEKENTQGSVELAYSENPFFSMPFNGSTGASGRNGYGMKIGMRSDGTLYTVTGTGTPYVSSAFNAHDTLESLAIFLNEQKLPTLVELTQNMVEIAPSLPVGIKAQVSNPSGEGVLQYGIVTLNASDNYLPVESPVLWYDCTKSSTQTPVEVLDQAICSSKPNQQSIRSSVAGNDTFYTGIALVPDETYALSPVCAEEKAWVQVEGQSPETIDGVADGFTTLRLNSKITSTPDTLQEMIDLVVRGDACGKIENGQLRIIWDASSPNVVPKTLQCGSPINTSE
jgi:hypothetical protein